MQEGGIHADSVGKTIFDQSKTAKCSQRPRRVLPLRISCVSAAGKHVCINRCCGFSLSLSSANPTYVHTKQGEGKDGRWDTQKCKHVDGCEIFGASFYCDPSTVDDERSRKKKTKLFTQFFFEFEIHQSNNRKNTEFPSSQDNMKFLTIPALARLTTYVHNQDTTLNVYTQNFTLSLIRKVHISTIETRTEYCKIVWLDRKHGKDRLKRIHVKLQVMTRS